MEITMADLPGVLGALGGSSRGWGHLGGGYGALRGVCGDTGKGLWGSKKGWVGAWRG